MKKRKITGVLAATLLMGTILAACGKEEASSTKNGGAKQEEPKYTFRLADNQPPDYPTVVGDKKFAELVEERTNGRIKIEVFPSAQLGDEKSVLEQVQLGAIEFTRINSSPLAEFNDQFTALGLPYVFESEEHLWNFLNGEMGTKLLDGLEKSKMKGLAYYDSGSRSFYSTKPLKSVKDLKGQKIRVQQSKINIDFMEALGASATPMPYGEVFSALQTGIIDGAENNLPSFDSSNHYQEAKNIVLDNHQRIPEVLLISKTAWDKLSEKDQKLIKQAALDSVKTQREEWDKWEERSTKKLKDAGVVFTEVNDIQPWKDAVKSMVDSYSKDYKEVMDAIEKARP
ncbi:TRAP transporter substrate-binding protein [Neobacillus cucumis]|uniref:TRAP transporter substrate-binding protein n=1 Tax=Neobacillus cucumis TaxID=1740721 RepID=UPI00203B6008|nr:TRAP transporter substrate-binding protein [Neobacillus cucumis]MCM3728283.1 TRAP transporter substrate-binding protein [Neobacillus cucumis]